MTDEHPIQRRRAGRPWSNGYMHTWYESIPGVTVCLRCRIRDGDGRAADPCEALSLIEIEDRDRPEQMAAARKWLRDRHKRNNAFVTADSEAQAVYIKMNPDEDEVARTHFVESLVGVDFDADGRVIGIELLSTVPPGQWDTAWQDVPTPSEDLDHE